MPGREARRRKAKDIKERASAPPSSPQRCIAFGCTRPTQRASGEGLSNKYCKAHKEFRRRHGSTWRRTYSAKEFEPYRKAAWNWFWDHNTEPQVRHAVGNLNTRLELVGRPESPYKRNGLSAKEKERIAWAYLRESGRSGTRLFIVAITILATNRELGPHANPEFVHVQIAKMALRLVRLREVSPKCVPIKYPRSEGLYLRLLGERIQKYAEQGISKETIEAIAQTAKKGCGK